MAPTFFASTPTSRRNRRRQQKLCKRNQQTESASGHTSKRTKRDPQSWVDTRSIIGYVATFDPSNFGRRFNADRDRSRPRDSNPFSLLDVSIPSPTLSIPPTRRESVGRDLPNQQHDLNGIKQSPAADLPAFSMCKDPNKQLRGDAWALSLQQNTAVVRSGSLTNRVSAVVDLASVKPPPSSSPQNHEPSTITILPTGEHEDAFDCVPSPLLYHRKLKETSSSPTGSQSPYFTPPSQSIDRYTSGKPVVFSTIGASVRQDESFSIDTNTSPLFIAARLSPMGDALLCNVSNVEGTLASTGVAPELTNDCMLSAVAYKLPRLTTTNTYIFPERVYNAYCQPDAAWSGPSYTNTQSSWKSSRKLVFPKLSIPGGRVPSQPSPTLSDTGSDGLRSRHHQGPSAERNRLWFKTSLPAPLPQMFDSRCRSLTQDSFDSKFNVSTATKQVEPAVIGSVGMQPPPTCSTYIKSNFDAAPETVSIDTEEAQPEEDAWNGNLIEWSPDASCMQTVDDPSRVEGVDISLQKGSNGASKLDEEQTALDRSSPDENTSQQTYDAWLDYHAPYVCIDDDIGSEVHVDINGVEVNDDNWVWNDEDDWETIASTPATEVDGQLGLDEDEWAW